MKDFRQARSVAARIGIAFSTLGFILFIAGCGVAGTINGQIVHEGYIDYLSVGGFPTTFSFSVDYPIAAGTYDCYYTLDDGVYFYPGPTSSYYYHSTYTVAANPATSVMTSGADSYFSLYLSYSGLMLSGSVQSIEPLVRAPGSVVPRLGTQSWTTGNLLITVTNKIVTLTPDALLKLQQTRPATR